MTRSKSGVDDFLVRCCLLFLVLARGEEAGDQTESAV